MLSAESQILLARIMTTLGDTELRIESSRCTWAKSPGFDPLSMFRKLDHLNTGHITFEDLSIYLSDHQIKVPLQEQLFLFSWFDGNGDGKAEYEDFAKRLRPVGYDNEEEDRVGYAVPDTDFDFLGVILRELECVKAVLKLASDFTQRPDYSLSRAFFAISKGKKDIGAIVLGRFLEQTLHKVFPQNFLQAIIERLDLDEDGRISQKDLSLFLQRITHVLTETEARASSPLRFLRVRDSVHTRLPVSESSSLDGKDPGVELFAKVIAWQREMEISKQALATEHEIALQTVFRELDREKREGLTVSDLDKGLSELGVTCEERLLGLLVRHFDANKDGCLSQADFTRMLLSSSPKYNELHCVDGRANGSLLQLSPTARQTLASAFSSLLLFESHLEALRTALHSLPVDFQQLFTAVDIDQSGQITLNDLKQYLALHKVYPSLFELIAVIELLDGNRDGKVEFSEFVDVLSPKSLPSTERVSA